MPRFFVKENQIKDNLVEINGENVNHMVNVLRYRVGNQLTISTENGLDYICKIIKFEKDKVILNIIDCLGNETEPNLNIILYQALPKSDKMEFIIQKCVEIGVTSIVPMKTGRCIVKLEGKEEKKITRWNKISEAAAKQSQRGKIPKVENILTFEQAIKHSKSLDKAIIPYENEKNFNLKELTKNFTGHSIGIFIGPEGGFTKNEIDTAIKNNVIPVTLGKRILRTETAGLFTSIILLHEMEN